jgi:hypothetical protein
MFGCEAFGVAPRMVFARGRCIGSGDVSAKSYYCQVKSMCDDEIFIVPRFLTQEYLSNCKVVCDRAELLRNIPKGGIVGEIGTWKGEFARTIIDIVDPDQLHVFDLDFSRFNLDNFPENAKNKISFHQGDSSKMLSKLADHYFDWIYIDGDHSFEGVTKDIEQAVLKVKSNGYIVFNDYTIYSALEKTQYGVMRAVNHLCLEHDYEICLFALSICDYPDVALRKRTLAQTKP